jgi:hypothetical protein
MCGETLLCTNQNLLGVVFAVSFLCENFVVLAPAIFVWEKSLSLFKHNMRNCRFFVLWIFSNKNINSLMHSIS